MAVWSAAACRRFVFQRPTWLCERVVRKVVIRGRTKREQAPALHKWIENSARVIGENLLSTVRNSLTDLPVIVWNCGDCAACGDVVDLSHILLPTPAADGSCWARWLRSACAAAGFGLLPAALSSGIGVQAQQPLARVVVGGLVTSPLAILFLIPVVAAFVRKRGTNART
jgi:hypothetical protein